MPHLSPAPDAPAASAGPQPRSGVLLVNLGSPRDPGVSAVRRYLREFLSDPRVIDIHPAGRALLLYLFILPFRPRTSSRAYRSIWTEAGSPLIVHSRRLAEAVARELEPEVPVALAMRYGEPSIRRALDDLRARGADRIVVFPLYPQLASSSTGTVLEKVFAEASRAWNVPDIATVPPFYREPGLTREFAAVGRPLLESFRPDHVLMSFHGLPERHIRKSDPSGARCLASASCCDRLEDVNRFCYRAQCYETARRIARELSLAEGSMTVTFQSRLGRTPWIRPYTDLALAELPGRGVKRVAVFCPSFVADCLETLEEIGIRGREQFRAAGGEELLLVPSLNEHPGWVETVVRLVRREIRKGTVS